MSVKKNNNLPKIKLLSYKITFESMTNSYEPELKKEMEAISLKMLEYEPQNVI